MAKTKKSSKLIAEYRKQRRRIQNLTSSYRRKGYDVQFELPAIPKRITEASIRRLRNITPKTVQAKTFGIDVETGEQISYYRGQQQRRVMARRIKKTISVSPMPVPSMSNVIINSFRYQISQYPPSAFLLASRWLDAQIATNGTEEVAKMLQKGADEGLWLTPKEAYKDENIKMMINGMMDFLGFGAVEKREFMGSIDDEYSNWEVY